ncbi:MAG: class A beta-lactamase-related serine hydrolase [Sphingobacteriales bacterium]|nr:MAG: class A beta-lactamase-related serine hydrolase [Sphingobacteriales bacterium]
MKLIKPLLFTLLFISVWIFDGLYAQQLKLQKFSYATTPDAVGFSALRLARIDSLLTKYTYNSTMPNAVTFIAKNGKIVHFKSYGYSNIESKTLVKNNSIFRIASQTKAITSVALMMLYEEGKFLLDDPVSSYIPEFKNPQVIVAINDKDSSASTRPAKREITVRDLLSHTSGIPYGNKMYAKAKIPGVNSLENETIGSVVKRLAKLPISHDPGEAYTYGLNTDVLGYLVEVLSGMTLDKYFKTKIFEPLGMADTYFYLPPNKKSRLVNHYGKDSLNAPLVLSNNISNQTYPYSGAKVYFSGGAGLVGPIEDYAKFCQMLLNGGTFNGNHILSRKTIELMTTNQIGDKEVWDSGNKFGLGFEITTEKGNAKQMGSVGAYGWGGMYSTDYKIDPKENLIFLIYTNANPFPNPDINKRFRGLVYQALK